MNSSHLPLDKQVDIVVAFTESDPIKRRELEDKIAIEVREMKIAALQD